MLYQIYVILNISLAKYIISEIINGKAAIIPEIALQLEHVFNIPASFWNNREQQYREFLAQHEEKERLEKQVPTK